MYEYSDHGQIGKCPVFLEEFLKKLKKAEKKYNYIKYTQGTHLNVYWAPVQPWSLI